MIMNGLAGDINTSKRSRRARARIGSLDMTKNSKMSSEIMKDMSALNVTRRRQHSQKSNKSDDKFKMPIEEDEIIGILTSQVLGEVLANDQDLMDGIADTGSCDASSFQL
jgi:hypothetical protein